MELWTAFLLGLVGSLHCAGMCGPIALSIPIPMSTPATFVLSRLAYNVGRILTYCLLGALFGAVGKSFALIGWQRWVSLTAGIAVLVALVISQRISLAARVARPISLLKNRLGTLLRQATLTSTFLLGLMNGLLPCGLVYAACAGAAATDGFFPGVAYMTAFGLGTLPMMLGISLAGKKLQYTVRFKLQALVPVTVTTLGLLLILRGLALGIPYLSPDLAGGGCHH